MVTRRLLIALCSSENRLSRIATCEAVSAGDQPLEWIQLIPAGPDIEAFDGRYFRNSDPAGVVARFRASPLDLPIDWEHATEKLGPEGKESPAAGWITDLEVRDGSVWAKVSWTPRGKQSLASKEYRYISPAFTHDPSGHIVELVSAGLTNRPALHLMALAARVDRTSSSATPAAETQGVAQASQQLSEENSMDPKLLKALGLDEKATVEQVLAAVEAMKGQTAQLSKDLEAAKTEVATARTAQPQLDKFVPRADYEVAIARATTAEKQIADEKAASHKATVDAEIDGALKAGKITPATADYHRAQCSQEGGLDRFREFIKAAPVVVPNSGLDDKKLDDDKSKGKLSDNQLVICRRLGLTEEQFLKANVD